VRRIVKTGAFIPVQGFPGSGNGLHVNRGAQAACLRVVRGAEASPQDQVFGFAGWGNIDPSVSHPPFETAPEAMSASGSTEPVQITAALVRRAIDGDSRAWAQLYRRTYRSIYRRLRYLVGDPDLAEDLAQEVYVQAAASLARLDAQTSFSTWLHAIALNLTRKHWRSRRNTRTAHDRLTAIHEVQAPGAGVDVEAQAEKRRRVAALYEVLGELPDTLREAFVLRDLERLSAQQAAQQLGITPDNVWVRASRARTKIRQLLGQRGLVANKAQDSA